MVGLIEGSWGRLNDANGDWQLAMRDWRGSPRI